MLPYEPVARLVLQSVEYCCLGVFVIRFDSETGVIVLL